MCLPVKITKPDPLRLPAPGCQAGTYLNCAETEEVVANRHSATQAAKGSRMAAVLACVRVWNEGSTHEFTLTAD